MMISFGDGAADAFRSHVGRIPVGYTVALLGDHDDLPIGDDLAPEVDVSIVATTPEGVAYRNLGADGNTTGPIKIFRWEDLARVHVY